MTVGVHNAGEPRRTRAPITWGSVGLVVAASFYRPLVLWAENAWDLASPFKILSVGLVVSLLGLLTVWLLVEVRVDSRAAALGVAAGILILATWTNTQDIPVLVKVAVPPAMVWVGNRLRGSGLLDVVMATAVAVFGVAPLIMLAAAHFEQRAPYPLASLASPSPATASGAVEDVVVVVVDSYPGLRVAEDWYGHDTTDLRDGLISNGFDVEPVAWSRQTFTFLAVPSILELQPVVEEGPLEPWRNVSPLNRIMRGDNLVSNTLQSAGFGYTHVSSGVDGLTCGSRVDQCIASPWLDEASMLLLETSIAGGWIEETVGGYTVSGTLSAADDLVRIGADLKRNGKHDYVFAHLFLPHPPVVVDAGCQVLEGGPLPPPPEATARSNSGYLRAFSDQLSCVDDLLLSISGMAGPDTAMLIAADHGPDFGGQVRHDGRTWTDLDVTERLSILLAYHLPASCEPPLDAINVDVMRAIMSCAVNFEMPARSQDFFLGARDPVAVDVERMRRIRSELESGTVHLSSN